MSDLSAIKIYNDIPAKKGLVFAVGYTGKKPENLIEISKMLDATIVDVRYSPSSRVDHWRKPFLKNLLKSDYRHLGEFGNINYKLGDASQIRISDYAAGLEILKTILFERNAVLMCACEKPAGCHRRVLGELLKTDGIAYSELDLTGKKEDSGDIQKSLF